MRKIRWEFLVIALGALTMGAGCPLIPQIKDKVVELAVGGSTSVQLEAEGELNVHDDIETVDVRTGLDLQSLLDDANVDIDNVEDIKLAGVSYRVIQTDPTPNRQIVDGTITVQRGAGTINQLVTNFDVDVNNATTWQTANLDAAGVTALNGLLDDMLNELQGGPVAPNTVVTFHVNGTSTPGNVATDFVYEVKIDVSIVGTVEITTIE